MITIRKSEERGRADVGWLHARHSFSFGEYYDPKHMGFRSLRVINEDRIDPAKGFGTHPHKDMEIITYVIRGQLEHKDSMGNGSVIKAGTVQGMSAGSGVQHSEFNPSSSDPTHLIQIWIQPAETGVEPRYDQLTFADEESRNVLRLLVSGDAREDAMQMQQDGQIYVSRLDAGVMVRHSVAKGRGVWIQVVSGSVDLHQNVLNAGDGASIEDEEELLISALDSDTHILLFDLN
jgi:redox-sensitive bicupin YhaK (pirin superfamily)